jgi:hypothetical protein
LEVALGAPKHRLRQWIEKLPPLSTRTTHARSAGEFYVADLRFLFVIKSLVEAGIGLEALVPVSEALHRTVQQPAETGQYPVISLFYRNCWQLEATNEADTLVLHIPLRPAWEAVDAFLGTSTSPMQHVIGLGLTSIGKHRG